LAVTETGKLATFPKPRASAGKASDRLHYHAAGRLIAAITETSDGG